MLRSSMILLSPLVKRRSSIHPSCRTSVDTASSCRSFFSTTSTSQENESQQSSTTISGRRKFKEIPVNPGILRYIQMIGVGIPPRPSKRKKLTRMAQWSLYDDGDLDRNRRRRPRRSKQSNGDESTNSTKRQHLWKPPLPFGPDAAPVKIMGRISDTKQPLPSPRNTSKDSSSSKESFYKLPPQVALCGRSNVGKSTLLNALLYGNRTFLADNQQELGKKGRTPTHVKLPKGHKAVTSPRPGETRDITFYQLAARSKAASASTLSTAASDEQADKKKRRLLWLVDLPGFGFAHGSPEAKLMYQQLVTHYLLGLFNPKSSSGSGSGSGNSSRNKPKRILLLLDARHGMKKADLDFLEMLQQQQQQQQSSKKKKKATLPPIQLVLTKCDLVTQADLARRVVQVREQFQEVMWRETSRGLPILLVSARAGVGYNNRRQPHQGARGGVLELQKELASLAITTTTGVVSKTKSSSTSTSSASARYASPASTRRTRGRTTDRKRKTRI